jgi:hypothetical protein
MPQHSHIREVQSNDWETSPSGRAHPSNSLVQRSWTTNTGGDRDPAGRRRVGRALTALGEFLGTPSAGQYDLSEFKKGPAVDYPELPGENLRNRELSRIRRGYNQPRDEDGNVTPALRPSQSRVSFAGSVASDLNLDGSSRSPRETSLDASPARSHSPVPPQRRHAQTLPSESVRPGLRELTPTTSLDVVPSQRSPDFLEVPTAVRPSLSGLGNKQTSSTDGTSLAIPEGQASPAIVISSDPEFPLSNTNKA